MAAQPPARASLELCGAPLSPRYLGTYTTKWDTASCIAIMDWIKCIGVPTLILNRPHFLEGLFPDMKGVVLIATATLGSVMTLYLIGHLTRGRFFVACSLLAAAFGSISVSSALLAMHLVHDIPALVQMRALLALCAVPCLYLYFIAAGANRYRLLLRHGLHLMPVFVGIAIVIAGWIWLLDAALFATYLLYALALISIWRNRASHFSALGDQAVQTIVWLQTVILFLIVTVVLDGLITVQLAGGGFLRDSGPLLLSAVSLIVLVSFSLIGALDRPSFFEHLYSLSVEVNFQPDATPPDAEQQELAVRVLQLLSDPTILADTALTVTRLARKLRVPARQLSRAINRVHKCSFSDLLNDQRVQLCQRIMREHTDRSLLDIMLEAGYSTKSNFYRQFSMRTGLTPAAYRSQLIQETRL